MRLQVLELVLGKLEHEVIRKAATVPSNLLVEPSRFDSVKPCKFAIEDDLSAANQIYRVLNDFQWDYGVHQLSSLLQNSKNAVTPAIAIAQHPVGRKHRVR